VVVGERGTRKTKVLNGESLERDSLGKETGDDAVARTGMQGVSPIDDEMSDEAEVKLLAYHHHQESYVEYVKG